MTDKSNYTNSWANTKLDLKGKKKKKVKQH